MENTRAIIFVSGKSSKMKSKRPRFLHKICGKTVIGWVIDSVKESGINKLALVLENESKQFMEHLGDKFVCMEQKGPSSAIADADIENLFGNWDGTLLIVNGDIPLIKAETLKRIVSCHKKENCAATIAALTISSGAGYEKVLKDDSGTISEIVEQKGIFDDQSINTSIICINRNVLKESCNEGYNNLTGTINGLIKRGKRVGTFALDNSGEVLAVDDRVKLQAAYETLRKRIIHKAMLSGVTVLNPSNTYIDAGVEIGMDTVIYPGTILEGSTIIGEDCIIGPDSRIISSKIGSNAEINKSVVLNSSVGDNTKVGPFAYIRPESDVGSDVKIGDFVEIKKSKIGNKTKISHLSYVGDAEVGENVNIGCGAVFVNYNGKVKNKTVVGDNSFIGCNVNLVAPVEVKADAYVAAGSTITEEVPENALAIARQRQVVKENWVIEKGIKSKDK